MFEMKDENDRHFSLVIPLYNEEGSLRQLVSEIYKTSLLENGLKEIFLIDNGSSDSTRSLLVDICKDKKAITPIYLDQNINYGGAILYGLKFANTKYSAYMPGDLQVHPADLEKMWLILKCKPKGLLLYKGIREVRLDSKDMKRISKVYSLLVSFILGIPLQDVNGLPKIFDTSLVSKIKAPVSKTFVFDAQLLFTAFKNNFIVTEVDVSFHARSEGVSSWSGKRFRVYFQSIIQLILIRLRSLF
jgi:glycosyltransferase involved in cell wall biosynthesis